MNPRYSLVAERAYHRCEYCYAPEVVYNFSFEVEHILPIRHGGTDELSNYALSCRACNLYKSDQIQVVDPETNIPVDLFHPRRHAWGEHFMLNEKNILIVGLTPTGRATVHGLQMNRPAQLAARKQWILLNLFP